MRLKNRSVVVEPISKLNSKEIGNHKLFVNLAKFGKGNRNGLVNRVQIQGKVSYPNNLPIGDPLEEGRRVLGAEEQTGRDCGG